MSPSQAAHMLSALHTTGLTCLKYAIVFSVFTELGAYHCDQISERFHHLKKKSQKNPKKTLSPSAVTPHSFPPPAPGNH